MHQSVNFRRSTSVALSLLLALSSLSPVALAQSAGPGAPTAPKATSTDSAPAAAPAAPGGAAEPAAAEAQPAAPPPPTDEQREAARAAFEAGMAAFEAGDYSQATAEFKKAQTAIPSPFAEYWIALSLDKGDPEQKSPAATVEAYELFVSNPGARHVGPEKIDQSVQRIQELRKLLPATLTVITEPAGAKVLLNGEEQPGVTPLTLERPAGTYSLEARVEGYDPLAIEVALEGGITLEQQMNLVKAAPPPPPAEPVAEEPASKSNKVPAYVTLGIAGAGLITTTIFGIMALDSKSQYDQNPTTDLADQTERNALIADMALGITLTLGITGIVLLTSGPEKAAEVARLRPQAKPGKVEVTPFAGLNGGGARARVSF